VGDGEKTEILRRAVVGLHYHQRPIALDKVLARQKLADADREEAQLLDDRVGDDGAAIEEKRQQQDGAAADVVGIGVVVDYRYVPQEEVKEPGKGRMHGCMDDLIAPHRLSRPSSSEVGKANREAAASQRLWPAGLTPPVHARIIGFA